MLPFLTLLVGLPLHVPYHAHETIGSLWSQRVTQTIVLDEFFAINRQDFLKETMRE